MRFTYQLPPLVGYRFVAVVVCVFGLSFAAGMGWFAYLLIPTTQPLYLKALFWLMFAMLAFAGFGGIYMWFAAPKLVKASDDLEQEISEAPNSVPLVRRITYLVISPLLMIYGAYGLYIDDVFVPGKSTPGVHFHGLLAWMVVIAMFCMVVGMLSEVVDHYDTRSNERKYKIFADTMLVLSYFFFLIPTVLSAWL